MRRQRDLDRRAFGLFLCFCLILRAANLKTILAAPFTHNFYRLYNVLLTAAAWIWVATAPEEQYLKWRNTVVLMYKMLLAATPMLRSPAFLQSRLQVPPATTWAACLLEPIKLLIGSRIFIMLLLPVLLPQPLLQAFISQFIIVLAIRNNESLCSTQVYMADVIMQSPRVLNIH